MNGWHNKEEFKRRVLEWANKLGIKSALLMRSPNAQQVGLVFPTKATLSFNDELVDLDR